MKLSQYAYLAFTMAGAVIASSCIRDEIPDCPALQVNIIVKDKNYFNVDKVDHEDRISEDLPFREYVPTLYWVLRDVATGDVVDGSNGVIRVNGDEKSVTPSICPCIPHGKYVLTVWGGLESSEHLTENMDRLSFHPGNTQGADVYMTNDTILYDAWHNNHTVELERTKGKLIVEKVGIPSYIVKTEKNITGIYGDLHHHNFTYGGETSVRSLMDIADHSRTISKTFLSPSVKKDGSNLNIQFLSKEGLPDIKSGNVKINMYRNELTWVRYVWDPATGSFKIYVKINDSWELVNNMGIL
ncbi:MAG: FimB/Mfa2 family fimbrial subunit [Muribaculaceae bacterium]|nr:FimB/Mfa2 family fimbrial subunit [Muribaculaceae bacterium]